ncbi:sugar isomerase domain-containing protein [Nocardioides marmoriginsengisoli]|uniref:Sugar isomerase domain-containing protein n=1 Tax=Nocardioides marmoriginsengisoli TaxID=661483 RepID=A0A3N0CFA2_9ACTN|nr:sugar isomerase domain-containing protein [Nocardioides marmoriginsengisoli]RNL62147.1 sugar isomerase domain-containing protein [Nocardioides marmoriginsengisoli]
MSATAAGSTYLERLAVILGSVARLEQDAIGTAAEHCARAIEGGGYAHLFGTGHSQGAAVDAYPRIGGFDGFNPILEPSLTRFQGVVGNEGLRPISFFEQVGGLAEVILVNQLVTAPDAMIVISNSGINPVVVELAAGCRALGVPVIAVTSLQHTASTESRHASGAKLVDHADVVIDTHIPPGDALVHVDGLDYAIGAASSVIGPALVQALVSQTGALLAERGVAVAQIPSHNRHDEHESSAAADMERSLVRWAVRRGRRLDALAAPDGPWGHGIGGA